MKKQVSESFITKRVHSLDALRGFDMFWIIGADQFFHRLADASDSSFWKAISVQFTHPQWNGFHFYDLIFPLFLFIAGVATPFSVNSRLGKGKSKEQILLHIVRRGMILVLLGIFYNNGLEIKPISDIRFSSVLGRIGLAYMLASIIYLYARERMQYVWFALFLVGYWLLLKFNSAPGFPRGDLTMEGNFASYIDRNILPGRLSHGIHDALGLVSTIPAISSALLGIFAGTLLKDKPVSTMRKAGILTISGIILLILGQIWSLDFPINKNLWNSSYVLHTGGLSLLLLAAFYYIIDIKGYIKWSFFFRVIGMNSILIYISGKFIDWKYMTNAFFQWIGQLFGDPYQAVVMAACLIFVKWMFLYLLYQKKIFLRV